jgi:hypothetical protein
MTRITKIAVALPLLLSPLLAAPSSANLIVFGGAYPHGVMVMEDTGGEPVEIYPDRQGLLSISPSGPDGVAWVVHESINLTKFRTDGTGVSKLLCREGFYIDGTPYSGVLGGEWSPTGTEILVTTYQSVGPAFLGLLPADSTVGEDCRSDLVLLYAVGAYDIEGTPAWNDDGSQIAFFDIKNPTPRLVVLKRQATGWVESRSIDVDTTGLFLDWRRGGNILVFSTRGPYEIPYWLYEIDLDLSVPQPQPLMENGSRVQGRGPSWSADGSQLVFDRLTRSNKRELIKWDYPNGPGEVIARGTLPDWQRDPLVLTCESDSDCVDGNPCTEDLCGLVSGDCSNPPVADETPCGTYGWCTSGFCFEPECALGLPPCDDGNECTLDQCSNWRCVFDPEPFGSSCSDGDDCTADDYCDGEGTCIGNVIPGCGCLPKGDPCSANDDCCSGLCHPAKGTCK